MPYTLTPADNPESIAECQYGQATTVWFTKFTSCIGILAKVADAAEVIGIHLVLRDAGDNPFSAADVPQVVNVLQSKNYDPAQVIIIGLISAWEGSAPAAYQALVDALQPQKFPYGDGIYGGEIGPNGLIAPTYREDEG